MTDENSLAVTTMVLNGQINTMILAACRQVDLPAVGISGVDAGLIRAHKRPPVRREDGDPIDYGFVGDIDGVDASIILKQLDSGLVPVISPLSADESGTLLNINADTEIALVAVSLSGDALEYVGLCVKADREIVLAAAPQNGYALECVELSAKADKEIVPAAVRQNGDALEYVKLCAQTDREIILAAVQQNGYALECA